MTDLTEDEQYQQDADEVCQMVQDEVWPILMQIDDDYPDHSAFFTMFIDAMHILFHQGWTMSELIHEVLTHHAEHVQSLMEDFDTSELH